MGYSQRRNLILRLAEEIEDHIEEFAYLEALDNGKPYEFLAKGEMKFNVDVFRYYAGWTDKIQGNTIPMNGPFQAIT